MMKRLLALLLLALPWWSVAQSSLPPCPVDGIKHECWGEFTAPTGAKFVGEWHHGLLHGEGVQYRPNGSVFHSGVWDKGSPVWLRLDSKIDDGRYVAGNMSELEGEISDGLLLLNVYRLRSSPQEVYSCTDKTSGFFGFGRSRLKVDADGSFSGRCQFHGRGISYESIASGTFPNLHFTPSESSGQKPFPMTLTEDPSDLRHRQRRESKRNADAKDIRNYEKPSASAAELVVVDSTKKDSSPAQPSSASNLDATSSELAKALSESLPVLSSEYKKRNRIEIEAEANKKLPLEQNALDEKRRLEIRQQEEARSALEIKQRDERLSEEQKLLADKLRQQQDEQRKSLEREQQMAAQLREMQEKLQQQMTVAQQLQRQLEEAKAAASKVAVLQGGKHALIIGIDQYQSIPKLKNAIADAREVATTLRGFGYAIRQHSDLNERGFKQAIREFMASINPGDEVIVFYAGHGVQIGGLNFFLPADTRGESERQVRDEAIQLQRILDDLSEAKPSFALVIVDACRDNPFKGQGRNFGGRGLSPTTAASGQMIIFSAGANQQALDVLGPTDKAGNSVFTRVLVAEMKKPNLSIDRLARNVRTEVVRLAKSVGHEQVPALYDQSIGEFYLNRK